MFVLPLRNGDTAREDEFDMFFNARMDDMVDFTGAVFRRAAKIRAPTASRLPTHCTWPPPSWAAAPRS